MIYNGYLGFKFHKKVNLTKNIFCEMNMETYLYTKDKT